MVKHQKFCWPPSFCRQIQDICKSLILFTTVKVTALFVWLEPGSWFLTSCGLRDLETLNRKACSIPNFPFAGLFLFFETFKLLFFLDRVIIVFPFSTWLWATYLVLFWRRKPPLELMSSSTSPPFALTKTYLYVFHGCGPFHHPSWRFCSGDSITSPGSPVSPESSQWALLSYNSQL